MMLDIIRELRDDLVTLIKDDPVRPEIPVEQRVGQRSEIFVLRNDHGEPLAVTCVKFLNSIPETVEDLVTDSLDINTAVFYTIWSYVRGAGRELITEARNQIAEQRPEVTTFVTLSPKTEMARQFHLKNGAEIYRENSATVNYLYR
jgi:hypothetical protein